MSVSSPEQNKHVTCMENGDYDFPSSSREKRSGLNSKDESDKPIKNENEQSTPHHKQVTKDVIKLEVAHVNCTNPMKNASAE